MTGATREVVSAASGLAAFGVVLLIETSLPFLIGAGIVGIVGYAAPRLLIPRTREIGEAVTEASLDQSNMSEAELVESLNEQGVRYDVWLKSIMRDTLKDRPEVIPEIERIRGAIRGSFRHLQKDRFGVRTFAGTMTFYLDKFETSLKSYVEFLGMEHKNQTVERAIGDFEAGLPDFYRAFDAVFTVLVQHDIDRLETLRREFRAVLRMKEILGEASPNEKA